VDEHQDIVLSVCRQQAEVLNDGLFNVHGRWLKRGCQWL
jgi:hypothetical protein